MHVEQVTPSVAYHGEGPVWSARWGGLRWVDMLAGDVLSLRDDGSVGRLHTGSRVAAAIRPRAEGGMVIGIERGFAVQEEDGGEVVPVAEAWSGADLRMNEGGCDPEGRFWCGSMAYDRTPGAASVYRLDAERSVETMLTGVTISNGLDWSPDGSLAYYNDTETSATSVFDYDRDAGLTNRRPFVDLSDEELRPDGLTVDAEGGVWIALSNGGAVRRYSAEGKLEAVIELPVTKVTACTFGGERLDRLFITTSREDLPDDEEPRAGSLFVAEPGVFGLPVREYTG